jgi:hypothetical protein
MMEDFDVDWYTVLVRNTKDNTTYTVDKIAYAASCAMDAIREDYPDGSVIPIRAWLSEI